MKPGLKKALKITGITLGGLFVLVTGVGFCLPHSIHVERSVVVQASSQQVYPLIANFKQGWPQWSPFQNEADDMRMAYSGPEQGVGAKQSWESEQMGDGHMELTEADPSRGVVYDLRLMHDSFRLNGSLICAPAENEAGNENGGRGGSATKVTWTDDVEYGSNPYRRYMGLMVKKGLGDAFDKGLAALKTKAEAQAVASPSSR
jgi:hypothetical protein